jgi:ribonuclease HII
MMCLCLCVREPATVRQKKSHASVSVAAAKPISMALKKPVIVQPVTLSPSIPRPISTSLVGSLVNVTGGVKDRVPATRGVRVVTERRAPVPSIATSVPAKRLTRVKSEPTRASPPSSANVVQTSSSSANGMIHRKLVPSSDRVILHDPVPASTLMVKVKPEPASRAPKPKVNPEPKSDTTDSKKAVPGGGDESVGGGGGTGNGNGSTKHNAGGSGGGGGSTKKVVDGKKDATTHVKREDARVKNATSAPKKKMVAVVVPTSIKKKKNGVSVTTVSPVRKRTVKGAGGGGGNVGNGDGNVKSLTRAEIKLARETSTTSFAMEQNMFDLHDSVAYVAGWDEVGRGCYFGPVMSAVCVVARGAPLIMNVYDSKKYPKKKKKKKTITNTKTQAMSKLRGTKKETNNHVSSSSDGGGGDGDGGDAASTGVDTGGNRVTMKRKVGSGGVDVDIVKKENGNELCVDKDGDEEAQTREYKGQEEDEELPEDEAVRERICDMLMRAPGHYFRLSRREAHQIDATNIRQAVEDIMCEAILNVRPQPDAVFIDGDILPSQLRAHPQFQAWTVIKGDSKCYTIAAASIVAKVTRDREMRRLARAYPRYGLEDHMGYGTYEHELALYKYGMTDMHRRSFQPMRGAIERGGIFFPPKLRGGGGGAGGGKKKKAIAAATIKSEPEALEQEQNVPAESA